VPTPKIYVTGPMFLGGPLHATSATGTSGKTFAHTRTIGVGEIHRPTVKTEPGEPRQYRASVTDFYRAMPAPEGLYAWTHYVHASLTDEQAREYV
jgi:hypothetical protein